MTRKTQLIIAILADARRHDRDPGKACGRIIEENLAAIRHARQNAKRCESALVRDSARRRADRIVRENRAIRDLARQHGWEIPGEAERRAKWGASQRIGGAA